MKNPQRDFCGPICEQLIREREQRDQVCVERERSSGGKPKPPPGPSPSPKPPEIPTPRPAQPQEPEAAPQPAPAPATDGAGAMQPPGKRPRINQKIYDQLAKQLANNGERSIRKALRSARKTLKEHEEKLPSLEYRSQVESTIENVKRQIQTIEQFMRDNGITP